MTAVRAVLFVLALAPFVELVRLGAAGGLGANPVEFVLRWLGTWTLAALPATLAVTPLRWVTGWAWLIRLRRMLGLYAFFDGSLHVASFVWIDHFFNWVDIVDDITQRPYLTFGFARLRTDDSAGHHVDECDGAASGRTQLAAIRIGSCTWSRCSGCCTTGITSSRRTTSRRRRSRTWCLERCWSAPAPMDGPAPRDRAGVTERASGQARFAGEELSGPLRSLTRNARPPSTITSAARPRVL